MPPSPTDPNVARVQALFVQHAAQVRGFIVALMPDLTQVDDVLQETFLTITAKADTYDINREFISWACGIARFKVMEVGRRMTNRAWRPLSDEVLDALAASEPDSTPADDAAKLGVLDGCLEGLGPQARRVVELCYQQEHKPLEIAKRMEWTVDSVYVALSRARLALRRCIERKLGPEGMKP
jgi:RNA polymerase sigma-70 factor (ECF subfamily)